MYKAILEDVEKKKIEKEEIKWMQKQEIEEAQARIKQTNAERDSLLLRLRDKEKVSRPANLQYNSINSYTL